MDTLIDRDEIEKILPQRKPFLFVDKVYELDQGKRIIAARRFDPGEYFFEGHFPGNPIVPGVILLESMAQAAGILAYRSTGTTYLDRGAILLRFDKISFRRLVRPDEEVELEAQVLHTRGPVWKCEIAARVGGETCAGGQMMASFTEKTLLPLK